MVASLCSKFQMHAIANPWDLIRSTKICKFLSDWNLENTKSPVTKIYLVHGPSPGVAYVECLLNMWSGSRDIKFLNFFLKNQLKFIFFIISKKLYSGRIPLMGSLFYPKIIKIRPQEAELKGKYILWLIWPSIRKNAITFFRKGCSKAHNFFLGAEYWY